MSSRIEGTKMKTAIKGRKLETFSVENQTEEKKHRLEMMLMKDAYDFRTPFSSEPSCIVTFDRLSGGTLQMTFAKLPRPRSLIAYKRERRKNSCYQIEFILYHIGYLTVFF